MMRRVGIVGAGITECRGRWVEKTGQRRRRFYRLTAEGKNVLGARRRSFAAFVDAVRRIVEAEHA